MRGKPASERVQFLVDAAHVEREPAVGGSVEQMRGFYKNIAFLNYEGSNLRDRDTRPITGRVVPRARDTPTAIAARRVYTYPPPFMGPAREATVAAIRREADTWEPVPRGIAGRTPGQRAGGIGGGATAAGGGGARESKEDETADVDGAVWNSGEATGRGAGLRVTEERPPNLWSPAQAALARAGAAWAAAGAGVAPPTTAVAVAGSDAATALAVGLLTASVGGAAMGGNAGVAATTEVAPAPGQVGRGMETERTAGTAAVPSDVQSPATLPTPTPAFALRAEGVTVPPDTSVVGVGHPVDASGSR